MPHFVHFRVSELQVAALSNPSPAIERQALEICINRLGGNPEDGVDLEDGEIVVALTAGEAVIGGGTYKHAPHRLWVCALGCLERQGGAPPFCFMPWRWPTKLGLPSWH